MRVREIKFRGYDLDANKWRYGNLVAKPTPFIVGQMIDSCEEYCNLEFWWPVVYKSVGQFTGLKDKHGKEIYEGDIIAVRNLHDGHEMYWNQPNGPAIPFEIKWHEDYLCWDMPHDTENFEIIGNIYENPELLTPNPGE